MPLFQHRFMGALPAGDEFSFSWWNDTSLTIDTAHGNAVTWANDFWNGVGAGTGYAPLATAGVVLQRITTGEITPLTGQQQALRETSVAHAGTAVGNALPGDVCIVVSLRTPLANRSGRGRFYLPQPAASTLAADGRIAAASVTALNTALFDAWTVSNGAGSNPVVYSRTLRSSTAITTFNVGDLFDTQRRRENALTEVRQSQVMP